MLVGSGVTRRSFLAVAGGLAAMAVATSGAPSVPVGAYGSLVNAKSKNVDAATEIKAVKAVVEAEFKRITG